MSKNISDFCSGINHVGVPTLDYNKSVAFYEGLGFKKASTKVNPNGQQVAFMQCGNLIVEIYDKEGAAMKTGAINHIAVDVHNIDELHKIIKAKGFKFIQDKVTPLPYWEKGIKYFSIEGPNKETIEFCERLK